MAEGVVKFLLQKVASLAMDEANLFLRADTQIRSFQDELQWINSFLRDADKKRRIYERVDVWVSQIRDVAYDADDIIDSFMLEVLRQRQRNVLLTCVCYPKDSYSLREFIKKIDDVNRRIEKISANKSKYGIETLEAGQTLVRLNEGLAWKLRRTSIKEELEDVVGMKKDMDYLAMLLTKKESQQLRVVSIVAMGGSGKTTLAKSIYKRSDVQKCFDFYTWIYVSQEFNLRDLLYGAIKQVKSLTQEEKKKLEAKNELELGKFLSDYLKERRCLLVFDDVWRRGDWDRIKDAFLCQVEGAKQRRVLLTTRNREVAEHADPLTVPHELKPLDDKEGFKLFLNKVFQFEERSSLTEDLKDLGKQLVAKCDGLPLAIVVLGGLLSTKEKTPNVWSRVLESVTWHLSQGPDQCMEILTLSYTNLPYYLQSCFLYFGLFPEDHEIESTELIQLWVAEGFIQQRGDEAILEDIAEEYLEELIQRSLIQATSRRSNGGVETCRIHDLLRDFAISESKKDKLLEIYGDKCSTSLNRFRRLTIHSSHNGKPRISAAFLNHLPSLLCFSKSLHKKFWKGLYLEFNLLRVLNLKGVQSIQSLPKEIGGLLLLKYLNLSQTRIRRIPHSMRNLHNLQTFDLSYTKLLYIPNEIWRMQQLRHLYCHGFFTSSKLSKWVGKVVHVIGESCSHPPRIDNLRNLQTLSLEAGSWIKGGLDKLTNLRELQIHEDLTLYTKALTVSIPELKKLRTLSLFGTSNGNTPLPLVSFSHHVHLYHLTLYGQLEKLPESKDFPPYLTELRLYNSGLKQDDQPMATLEMLPNLKILFLLGPFGGKEMICSGRGFAKLQTLELMMLINLEDMKVEQGAFPCLKVFIILQCRQLKMLPDGLRHVTTLQELNICHMSKEFEARVEQEKGEDWEKIKHIPNVSCL